MRLPLILVAASLAAASAPQQTAERWPVAFTDIGARAGLVHPSIYGGVDRKRFIIEANGCGTGFVDYDNDGWIDALVLNGMRADRAGERIATEGTKAHAFHLRNFIPQKWQSLVVDHAFQKWTHLKNSPPGQAAMRPH